jgi:hypothetical protein
MSETFVSFVRFVVTWYLPIDSAIWNRTKFEQTEIYLFRGVAGSEGKHWK